MRVFSRLKWMAGGALAVLVFLLSRQGALAQSHVPGVLSSLDRNVRQAVVMSVESASFKAKLSFWERKEEDWQMLQEPVDAVIGKNGLAPYGEKKEGDGRTPSGIYPIERAFGYEASVPTQLFYRQTTVEDFWVDDPESEQYNQWVTGAPQARSYERLRRTDDLYKYGIVIEYNTGPIVPGRGSAIFIHVWRAPDAPTAGCVAISEENLLKLLAVLRQPLHPVIILGEK